jgi:hypothetical protein
VVNAAFTYWPLAARNWALHPSRRLILGVISAMVMRTASLEDQTGKKLRRRLSPELLREFQLKTKKNRQKVARRTARLYDRLARMVANRTDEDFCMGPAETQDAELNGVRLLRLRIVEGQIGSVWKDRPSRSDLAKRPSALLMVFSFSSFMSAMRPIRSGKANRAPWPC